MGTSNKADKVLHKVTIALLYGSLKSGILLHVQMWTAATHLRFCHGIGHYCPADVKQIITSFPPRCHFFRNNVKVFICDYEHLNLCLYSFLVCCCLVLGCSWCICYVNVTHLVFDWPEKNVFKNCVRLLIKWCVFVRKKLTLKTQQRLIPTKKIMLAIKKNTKPGGYILHDVTPFDW